MPSALIIDDSRQAADSLVQMLDLLGVSAQPAYGARAGMLMLGGMHPDIIFLDVHMAGVSGFEVAAYLRRLPQFAETAIVFVTSDDQPETKERAIEVGALDLIVKPASIDLLEDALRRAQIM